MWLIANGIMVFIYTALTCIIGYLVFRLSRTFDEWKTEKDQRQGYLQALEDVRNGKHPQVVDEAPKPQTYTPEEHAEGHQ